MIKENIESIKYTISEAANRAHRDPSEVTLIAVSKFKPCEMIMEAYDAGIRDFGENHVQELVGKIEELPKDIRWHMIGHLQTNKVKYIINSVYMIHSVESEKLALEISKQAVKAGRVVPILVEVNIGGEESKYGVKPEECEAMVENISSLPGISIKGLMTVAPNMENAEDCRGYFRSLRQLAIDITNKNLDNVSMDVLSMGMSGDYSVAVEEGATCVRVGSSIFGARNYDTKS